jgi:hypothetical protein
MPHLLNFLLENGTVSGNHYTPLISHTAADIVTSLTGVYGDRFGWSVANSYFRADGSMAFPSRLSEADAALAKRDEKVKRRK